MAKANSYFIQHVHNTEALFLKNEHSLNSVGFCLFVCLFSKSRSHEKKTDMEFKEMNNVLPTDLE